VQYVNRKLSVKRWSNTLFFLLISADVFIIVLNILHLFADDIGFFRNAWLSFEDRGFAESYTYIKEYWIVLLLFLFSIRKSKVIYFFWSLLCGYLLIDDSCRVHERLGSLLANNFGFTPIFGLREQDIGEFCVYVFSGVAFLVPLGVMYYRSGIETKLNSRCLFSILAILAFFGVLVDMVRQIVKGSDLIIKTGRVFENGGEMFAISIMLWFVFCLVTNERCRLDICDLLQDKSSWRLVRYINRFICVGNRSKSGI
jgi:hypothetical protein